MVGQDFHRWTWKQHEEQHKRREAWLLGFLWGGIAAMTAYAFALATGKALGLL